MDEHKTGPWLTETVESAGTPVLRNRGGQVTLFDGAGAPSTSFEIPYGRTALSVLMDNRSDIASGDRFDDKDWWQYRNGARYKKWLTGVEYAYKRVWPPHLENLPHLLDVSNRLWDRLGEKWNALGRMIERSVPEGQKRAAYMILHHRQKSMVRIDLEVGRENWGEGWTYWVGSTHEDIDALEAPDDLARIVWEYETAARRSGSWEQIVEYAFKKRVLRSIPAEWKASPAPMPVRLRVSGFDFWFQVSKNAWGMISVTKLAWPRERVLVIEGGGEG